MPLYSFTLDLPANTAQSSPVEKEVALSAGIIRKVVVDFPTNCAGLAHVTIHRFEHQIWPANADGDLATDGQAIPWDDEEDITEAPHTLRLVGWNEDDTYPHKISFWFNVLDQELVESGQQTVTFFRRLQKLLGL